MSDEKDLIEIPHLFKRMMTDTWMFGVKLSDGTFIPCDCIHQIKEFMGIKWVDLLYCQFDASEKCPVGMKLFSPPQESRNIITVRLDDISMIFELSDT